MDNQFDQTCPALKLPSQAPPVIRAATPASAPTEFGVAPSVDWDAVVAAAGPFLTGLASLMGGQAGQ